MSHLRELQLRFQDYLVGGSEAIEADIVSTENALAEHRLGAYYNAYRIRLINALAVDYPALEKTLGREAFENLALDYLQRYPSRQASVRWFGQQLPAYLAEYYQGEDAGFVCELANYEWAQTTVFDASDSVELFQLEDMARVAAEAWPQLTFEFKAAMLWLDLHWNVPQIETALDNGQELPQRQHSETAQRWLLWRRDYKTHWRSLDVHEAWALEQATNGANFAEICEGLLEWVDAQQIALIAAGFLKQWISDQLLTRVHIF
ncbi:MAG: DUF2063 domain-containing protein [Gammaproteobacteria bacterium]|nr:DUF2063 domain-containing protein [Gammaproteobacteria bacterium]